MVGKVFLSSYYSITCIYVCTVVLFSQYNASSASQHHWIVDMAAIKCAAVNCNHGNDKMLAIKNIPVHASNIQRMLVT